MIMPFLYRYPFRSVCSRGLASSFEDKNLFFVWTSTHDQYLSGGNVTCQTVTCYSEFVSALSVGLVSLCPSPSGLNYFDMAAMKCHNSLQFSVPPRETSSATKSEEKRMFSQASAKLLLYWRNGFRSFVCKVPGGGRLGGFVVCLQGRSHDL